MSLWNHATFSQLFAQNPREAFEYRLRILGEAIPEEYLTEEEKKGIKTEVEAEKKETPGYDKPALMKILRDAGVTFSPAANIEKLMAKVLENNLI